MRALFAFLLCCLAALPAQAWPHRGARNLVNFGDQQGHAGGTNYSVFISMFGATGYVGGRDYQIIGTYNSITFPNQNSSYYWWLPNGSGGTHLAGCTSVCGFMQQSYCDYFGTGIDCGSYLLNNMTAMSMTAQIRTLGATDGNTVIVDWFLVDAPHSLTRLDEFEIYEHLPANTASFIINTLPHVGNFTACGVPWVIGKTTISTWNAFWAVPTDTSLVTGNNYISSTCTFDLLAIMNIVKAASVGVNGTEYVNGFALGAEPIYGAGYLQLLNFTGTFAGH